MKSLPAITLAALVLLAACGGSSAGEPTPTPTPTPTATATPTPTPMPDPGLGSTSFEASRAFEHVQALTVDIGSRPGGSEAERQAAEYLRKTLAGYGYDVAVEPFAFDTFADAGSSLTILTPQGSTPAVYPFDPSANGTVEGRLVDAGLGAPDDFPAGADRGIALVERGVLFFSDKVANAAAAGAAGVIIYNNEPGLYGGTLDEPSTIPAAGLSMEDGEALLSLMAGGPVTARLTVATKAGPQDSQNVVARPPGGQCRVIAGGHYDSVPAGPGANDNASGTATVLEMARVLAADGELDGGVCFALFGSEELGLIGSARFVESLSRAELDALEGMFNFDMVSVGRRWLITGSPSLEKLASGEAEEDGLDYSVASTEISGSDHASFIAAGIPAVFVHSYTRTVSDDPNYHTANDIADNIRATRMTEAGRLGLDMIDALLADG